MEELTNVVYDSSTFFDFEDLDKTIPKDQFIDFLFTSFERISQHRFPNDKIKQKVRKHKDRITGSCPYCGDSMTISWKQRGNIILEGKHRNYYKCFNCGNFKRVDHFLKDFKINMNLDVINYIANNKGDFSSSVGGKYDISLLLDVNTIERYAIDRQELKDKLGLIEAKESPVWSWLNRRLQFDESKFLYNAQENFLIILNLTPSGKIIGYQRRNFAKDQTKYLTYSLPHIYETLNRQETIPENIESLSQLFGICEINFSHQITLFEGPMDAYLFPNGIANGGANKSFPIDLPRRYFYDDDKTGIKNALKRIDEGYSIFLWGKFKNDFGLPPRKKWDFNDIMIWLKENNMNVPVWDPYFSNDPMDVIDL